MPKRVSHGMAKPTRLKVFRTPIGFHDAFVAAPSQKAALEAWGSDANLFARGVAEQVTDQELTREPLANPGQVIKRLRGTAAENLAALPDHPRAARKAKRTASPVPDGKEKTASPATKPPPKPTPRPSRAALDRAERALDDLTRKQDAERAALDARLNALRREQSDLERHQKQARTAAERTLDAAREQHADALDRWMADQE